MKTPFLYGTPDLMYNWNNSVVFVVPLLSGRLATFAHETKAGTMGWLFSDHEDHEQRLGTAFEGQAFVDLCVELGFIVAHADNLNVPFSNGPRRRGEYEGQYTPSEYARVRQDLPSRDELAELARVL